MFTCICMCIFSVYSYTFTRSSDSLNLHIQICGYLLLIRYLERITCVTRSWSLFFLDHTYSYSFIHVIPRFYLSISCPVVISFLCSSAIIVLDIYMSYCSDIDLSQKIFMACSGYFWLSVYKWGILLAYIRHRLSSRFRFRIF